ncbi:MAG TPA: hypothetical protein VFN30_13585, partial [Chitinophagaceae bacterium]|nr:hypothetical protein [Chitinophagaceae bacterium]
NINSIPIHAYVLDPFGTGVIDNQFTSSKDFYLCPGTGNDRIQWVEGQTKAKNDIANAAAVLTDNKLFFAGDRTSNNGDAQIGFWFYLNGTKPRVLTTSPNVGGDFDPAHAPGDLLIIANFTGGGRNGTITVLKWVLGTAESGDGFRDVPGTNNRLDTVLIQGQVAENNDQTYPIPTGWSFIASTYETNEFYEGYIDLSQLNLPSLCFSSFLLEARSSQEITASLDDFAGGSFNARPQPPTVQGAERCGSGSLTLNATCSGSTVRWYAAASGGSPIATGSQFNTGVINSTTTYYASCYNSQLNCESDRVPVTATINNPPTASDSHVDVSCNGGSDGSVTITFSGGTGPYQIDFNGGGFAAQTSPKTYSGLAPGTYTWVVKDSKECTTSGSETVDQPTAVTASDSHVDVSCNGGSDGSVTINFSGGTPPYEVNFNGGGFAAQTSPKTYSSLAAGSYTWVVKDSKGCSTSGSETVGQPTAVTASDSHVDVSCNGGSDGSVTINFSGGTPPYEVNFNGGGFAAQTSPKTYSSLAAGSYSWVVRDSKGCSTSGSETVGQPTAVTASDSHTDASCSGNNDGSVTINFSGGTPPYEVDFNGGGFAAQTSPKTYSSLAAGSYTWVVRDSKGCSTSGSETVGQPSTLTASDSHVDVSCNGGSDGSVTINFSGGTPPYEVNFNGGGFAAQTSPKTYSSLAAGSYSWVVRDSKGCSTSGSETVGQPTAVTASDSHVDVSCNGGSDGSVTINFSGGTPPYEVNFNGGGFAAQTSPKTYSSLAAGSYTWVVRDSKGCSTSGSETVGQPTALTIDCSKTVQPSCFGTADGTIEVTFSGGTAPYKISMNGGAFVDATSPYTFPSLGGGDYTIVVKDANDCTIECKNSLTPPPQILMAEPTVTPESCAGANDGCVTIVVSGGTTPYNLTINGEAMTDEGDGVTFTKCGLAPGTYDIVVTDANQCIETSAEVQVPPGDPCGGPHCTYTQGQYGSYNGMACLPDGSSVLAGVIMYNALNAEPNKYKDFGSATKYFRLYLSDVTGGSGANIYKMLPGGGNNCALKGPATYSNLASWGNVPLSTKSQTYGKILNTLLAQTITMYFNLYMDPALGDEIVQDTIITSKQTYCGSGIAMDNTEDTFGFPHDVVVFLNNDADAYDYDNTVSGLFKLANDLLGGASIPVNCNSVAKAVDVYNNAFDGCRIQTGSIPYVSPLQVIASANTGISDATNREVLSETSNIVVRAYPNPYKDRVTFNFVSPVSGRAILEVFSLTGQRLAIVFDGLVKANVTNSVRYNVTGKPAGMLIYRMNIEGRMVRGKIQQIQ